MATLHIGRVFLTRPWQQQVGGHRTDIKNMVESDRGVCCLAWRCHMNVEFMSTLSAPIDDLIAVSCENTKKWDEDDGQRYHRDAKRSSKIPMVLRLEKSDGKRHRCETRPRVITILVGRRSIRRGDSDFGIWPASGVVKMVLQRAVAPNPTRTSSVLVSNFTSTVMLKSPCIVVSLL